MNELPKGVWLGFPENKPNDNDRVLIRRKGYGQIWDAAVYNAHYECWDDGEGDDIFCDLNDVDKFLIVPEI